MPHGTNNAEIATGADPRVGISDLLGRWSNFTNTETTRPATSAAVGKAGESPKGLGRDGNKPLMRNRTANEVPSPIGNAADIL